MTKKDILLIFFGLGLGLFFFFGTISKIFIPIQEKLFGLSATFAEEGESLPPPEREALCREARIQILEKENSALRKLLGLREAPSAISAAVVGREFKNPTHLILNRGLRDRVEIGSAVVSEEGFLVGKVIDVREATSTVRFLTDSQAKFSGMILRTETEKSPIIGVVEGASALGIRLKLIPAEVTLSAGDTVVTAGEELGVSRGIPIGEIQEVQVSPDIPLQEAQLKPFVSIDELLFVAILPEV